MTGSLEVELNGDGLHSVEAPPSFSATGAFDIVLENVGQAVHVHVHLDDELSTAASIDTGNHYVTGGDVQRVHVRTASLSEPVSGRLKIVTGYGAETAYVTVRIEPAAEKKPGIDVDETLSRPPKREPEPSIGEQLADLLPSQTVLPAVALGLLVLVVAGVVVTVVQNTVVVLTVGAILGAVAVAAAFVLREA
ncbi:DUF7524 family protein [Halogeometricum limi]|uniref:Uncharacterized protein n=1 Tax=Halogeometricum limi TaxID=555875 RepID=A0A1I6GRA2_9EURY|nr:hypothetical protein [Halogeometricum limi]SFR44708.1 hypothetical protein SAMN04488124_1430 [Halogeometricum limi]